MKRCSIWFIGLLSIVFMSSCSSLTTPTSTPIRTTSISSNEKTAIPTSPQVSKTSTPLNFSNIKFSIPSKPEPPPSGVLDQLVWGAPGGPGYDTPCNGCSITWKTESYIILDGFSPYQNLELRFYRRKGEVCDLYYLSTYVTSTTIQADGFGNANILLKGHYENISLDYVYDADTNQLETYSIMGMQGGATIEEKCNSCFGAPIQQVEVGGKAYVCTKTDSVRLRDGAGLGYDILTKIKTGTHLKVLDGAKCSNSFSWWKVETETGIVGWVAEGGDETDPYFICPIQ